MRCIIIPLVALFLISCGDDSSSPETSEPDDSEPETSQMNLSIFVVGYEMYSFLEADTSQSIPADGSTHSGLHFQSYYVCPDEQDPPGSYWTITFENSDLGDTVFHASIYWMGPGRIYHPDNFFDQDSLTFEDTEVPMPGIVEYFDYNGEHYIPDSETISRMEHAWNAIDNLTILHESEPCKLGFYLYKNSIGLSDPADWRWVLFVFRGC